VLYVTERCVFRLTGNGLELLEVAPGIDIDRDILAHMDFTPIIRDVRIMDARIFDARPMGLRDCLLATPLQRRFSYDAKFKVLFVDLRQLTIASEVDVESIRAEFAAHIRARSGRVHAMVNCRTCGVAPAVADSFQRMLIALEETCGVAMTSYGVPHLLAREVESVAHAAGPRREPPRAGRPAALRPLLATG
jgi:propionate CoA-transferase